MRKRSPALALLLALGLTACPKRPFTFGVRGELTDSKDVLAAVDARSVKLRALQADMAVFGEGVSGGGSTNGLIAVQRPASLKLELDDFIGNPVALLTTDGAQLGIYQASSRTFVHGAATAANLGRLVPVEVPLAEAVDLLLGDPRPFAAAPTRFFVDRDRYAYALVFEGAAGRTQRLDVDTETLLPTGVEVSGDSPYDAKFAAPESESGLQLPQRVELHSPRGKVSIRYGKIEARPAFDAQFFVPTAPPGAKVVSFGELQGGG